MEQGAKLWGRGERRRILVALRKDRILLLAPHQGVSQLLASPSPGDLMPLSALPCGPNMLMDIIKFQTKKDWGVTGNRRKRTNLILLPLKGCYTLTLSQSRGIQSSRHED